GFGRSEPAEPVRSPGSGPGWWPPRWRYYRWKWARDRPQRPGPKPQKLDRASLIPWLSLQTFSAFSGRRVYLCSMTDLFEAAGLSAEAPRPLADRLRPGRLVDVVGQDHLLKPDGPIGRMLAQKRLASMILWGPPGVGKTTIARLLADAAGLEFQQISAVFSGVADLKKAFETARGRRASGKGTLLFVDEIHRFNRAQQDGFLPYVEQGVVTLV